MIKIIKNLRDKPHYNGGEFIELAKGKNELVYSFKDFKRKLKRLWLLRKR